MVPTIPDGTFGYFGVVIPEHGFWQGYYLKPSPITDMLLGLYRQEAAKELALDGPRAAKGEWLGMSLLDQTMLGMACTMLVSRVQIDDYPGIAAAAPAIARIARINFFLIKSRIEAEGISSTFVRLADSIDTARVALRNLPEVLHIESGRGPR